MQSLTYIISDVDVYQLATNARDKLYSYRAFLKRLMAKQMTTLFKSNHINEPLLENNTNTDNRE